MYSLTESFLKTLVYADIFDYPLTPEELYRFLITDKSLSFSSFKKTVTRINTDLERIDTDGKFFFLKGRREIVALRKKRERWSRAKLKKAKKIASLLKFIPWVKMVGATGSLPLLNSDKGDDIDILIVSSKGRLWLTRLFCVLLLELLGQRRRPNDKKIRDKICLNMFLDEEHMAVPKKEQDLFSAHEVCQMKPLWEKDNTYSKFLGENQWVRKYLPNGVDTKILRYCDIGNKNKIKNKKLLSILISSYLNIIENFAYKFQLKYMRPHKTAEITEPGRILFHPQDARKWVLKEYSLRLKNLGGVYPLTSSNFLIK